MVEQRPVKHSTREDGNGIHLFDPSTRSFYINWCRLSEDGAYWTYTFNPMCQVQTPESIGPAGLWTL